MAKKSTPLLLYSANTWLAYKVAKRFYNDEHYVWCAPYFDVRALPMYDAALPPTSSPSEIYHNLAAEVLAGDQHSTKIKENKVGILKGATFKRKAGVINEQEEKDIAAIVEKAETRDFKPLMYVIPFKIVAKLVREVPVDERAHPLSVEYVIERLPRSKFDIINLERK